MITAINSAQPSIIKFQPAQQMAFKSLSIQQNNQCQQNGNKNMNFKGSKTENIINLGLLGLGLLGVCFDMGGLALDNNTLNKIGIGSLFASGVGVLLKLILKPPKRPLLATGATATASGVTCWLGNQLPNAHFLSDLHPMMTWGAGMVGAVAAAIFVVMLLNKIADFHSGVNHRE